MKGCLRNADLKEKKNQQTSFFKIQTAFFWQVKRKNPAVGTVLSTSCTCDCNTGKWHLHKKAGWQTEGSLCVKKRQLSYPECLVHASTAWKPRCQSCLLRCLLVLTESLPCREEGASRFYCAVFFQVCHWIKRKMSHDLMMSHPLALYTQRINETWQGQDLPTYKSVLGLCLERERLGSRVSSIPAALALKSSCFLWGTSPLELLQPIRSLILNSLIKFNFQLI